MKIDFRAFQDNLEKRDFLYSKIDSKTYLDDDITIQIDTLKFMIKRAKEAYKNGNTIDQVKEDMTNYIGNFLRYDIVEPTFNDFFVPRTLEYLNKNEDVLNQIKHYLINPVDQRIASLEKPEHLNDETPDIKPVPTLIGFNDLDEIGLNQF